MQYDVFDFIDSGTLREMLREKKLEPAVECILIAQCSKQSMKNKLAALTEREKAYSDKDFQAGVYHLRDSNSFADSLRHYITELQNKLDLAETVCDDCCFQVIAEDEQYSCAFHSYSKAVQYIRSSGPPYESRIIRRKLNDADVSPVCYFLNDDQKISDILLFDDYDWNIEEAFAELPDDYQVGDIVQDLNHHSFYVIAHIEHATKETRWLEYADYGDMSLYCLGYYPNTMHSCGGSFGHVHNNILQMELADPADLPNKMKPLLALSLLLKGKMRITDFLESYSNRALPEMMRYYERK